VFTEYRDSVAQIVNMLNAQSNGLIKAHAFIGQATAKGVDGIFYLSILTFTSLNDNTITFL